MSESDEIKLPKVKFLKTDFSTIPDVRLRISTNLGFDQTAKKDQVDLIMELEGSPFKADRRILDAPMRELFLWALVIGLKNNIQKPLSGTATDSIPAETFENAQHAFWLARVALLFFSQDAESIIDPRKVRKVAQAFANGGMGELYSSVQLGKVMDGLVGLVDASIPAARKIIEETLQTVSVNEEE